MFAVEETLEHITEDLLSFGTGLPDPLARILRDAPSQELLTLSLESVHGPLLRSKSTNLFPHNNNWNIKALPVLAEESESDKRFFFSMSDKRWEVLSCCTIGSTNFFTTLTLNVADSRSAPLRSGLFKLSDYFTIQCRNILRQFVSSLITFEAVPKGSSDQHAIEKLLLRQVASFSKGVKCAVLIDEDGFIVHAEGNAGSVEELGGALARLFYRSKREINMLDTADLSAITLADYEYTIRIGRLPGTTLALAVSGGGPFAAAQVHFLHAVASDALIAYTSSAGNLWGVPINPPIGQMRIRESWFTHPRLVPQGKFVGKEGGKSFHVPNCQILFKTDTSQLCWFNSRAAAIKSGLQPCGSCNP